MQRFLDEPAPEFSLKDLSGGTVKLSGLRGKVILLNFWYSSCMPCRREMPDLAILHKLYSAKGLVILGLNLDEVFMPESNGAELKKFLDEYRVPYPILIANQDVFEDYGQIPVQPTSFLVDRDGTVARIFWGAYPGRVFDKTIRPYLSAPPPAQP